MDIEEVKRIVRSLMPGQELNDEDIEIAFTEAVGSINGTMELLWRQAASRYAGLVDVQEGSSSRKLSQLYTQALAMADKFASAELVHTLGIRPGRTRRIVRDARE